jgi:hypothetical protein
MENPLRKSYGEKLNSSRPKERSEQRRPLGTPAAQTKPMGAGVRPGWVRSAELQNENEKREKLRGALSGN